MGLIKLLFENTNLYKKEEQYYKTNKSRLNNIVKDEELMRVAKESVDKHSKRYTNIHDYLYRINDDLAEWHNQYEDEYYDLIGNDELDYSRVMAYRQEKVLKALADYIKYNLR